jgi:hypothetical protein
MAATAAMVAAIAMVAVVAVLALMILVALVVPILVLFAPEVLRGMRRAALEIGTRAGLIQAWSEYGSRIRTGQGQRQPRHQPYYDRSEFHDDLPQRQRFLGWAD